MAATRVRTPRQAPAADSDSPYIGNLVLLVILGVAVSAWILYYTSWFPQFGGLLALGGVFSWMAFVTRILPEERLSQLQSRFDVAVLSAKRTRRHLYVAGLAGFALASIIGTVELGPSGSNVRDAWILPTGDRGPLRDVMRRHHSFTTAPNEPTRRPMWAGLSRRLRVKVTGAPDRMVELHGWQRISLPIPAGFVRPVVLLHGGPELYDNLRNEAIQLVVAYRGDSLTLSDYTGGSVWLGCDRDVVVPDHVAESWRSDVEITQRNRFLPALLYPRELDGGTWRLAGGDSMEVRLVNEDGSLFVSRSIAVHTIVDEDEFPQVEILNAPSDTL